MRRIAAAGAAVTAVTAAALATAVTVGMAAQPAQASTAAPSGQASTATHCPTSPSVALLPAGSGYLFPNLIAPVSACGFTDGGAPHHFTVDRATSVARMPTGQQTFTVSDLSTACSTVTVNGDTPFAGGCLPG